MPTSWWVEASLPSSEGPWVEWLEVALSSDRQLVPTGAVCRSLSLNGTLRLV